MADKDEDESPSETNEPWKEPGQISQDRSVRPPENPVQQEKQKKDANWEKAR